MHCQELLLRTLKISPLLLKTFQPLDKIFHCARKVNRLKLFLIQGANKLANRRFLQAYIRKAMLSIPDSKTAVLLPSELIFQGLSLIHIWPQG